MADDRVLVSPAPGQRGRLPCCKGDQLGRPAELGAAVGAWPSHTCSATPSTWSEAGLVLLAWTMQRRAPLARLHDECEVRDTILHVVAHALAGPAAGHGPAWRDVAARIGCSSRRCLPADAPRVPAAWVGVCSRGHTTERHRRPERVMTCARCSPTFALEHVLEWTRHGRPGSMHPNYLAELRALRAGESLSLLPVGARARVVAPGEFSGQVGTVLKHGRTSDHIEVAQGVLRVVSAAVRPA